MRYFSFLRLPIVCLLSVLWGFAPASAQKGSYDVRLVPGLVECGKAQVLLQVKAHSDATTFLLGNASFRFDFDPRQVKKLTLKSQDAFSSKAPASNSNYAPQSLTVQEGPTLATASLSVFYTGNDSDAKQVGSDWLTVATLGFEVAASDGCYGFTWHTDQMFPVTGMSEVVISSPDPFAYTLKEVPAGGVFGNTQQCLTTFASAKISGDTTINAGGAAKLKVSFTGNGPWAFVLSDNTSVPSTTDNPKFIAVSPTQTTTYTLQSMTGACGTGSVNGQVVVTVKALPTPPPPVLPTIVLSNFTTQEICAGQPLTVAFTTTGDFGTGNAFSVQLSDSTGTNFKTLVSGATSPLTATVPTNTPAYNGYRLRIIASTPATTSPLSSAFRVKGLPTASLAGDATLEAGQSASLSVKLTADAPWSFKLSDSTLVDNVTQSPYTVKVSPAKTTTYTLVWVKNACGVGTASGQATIAVKEKPAPTLSLKDFTTQEICAGQPLTVAFTTTGDFGIGNTFSVQLSDSTGTTFTTLVSSATGPLTAIVPANTPAHGGYRLRVIATTPSTTSPLSSAFRVKGLPTASLTGDATLEAGQSASLSVKLTGDAPWSFKLSDSTLVDNVTQSPYTLKVTPAKTTTYTLVWVKNACGTGKTSGQATLTVKEKPAPTVALNGFTTKEVCAGQPLTVAFTTTGDFGAGNTFSLQLSDSTGATFKTLVSGATSPLTATVPANTPAHSAYRLRVVASTPATTSPLSSAFRVKGLPTASLAGDATLEAGQSASLSVKLTADAPWSFKLSDSTLVENVTQTPYTLKVSPAKTTTYTLVWVKNACGVGTASGQARVTVNAPPPPPVAVCKPAVCVPVLLAKNKRTL